MRKISEALYKEEIEELLGKLFSGNITCITYELLKDTTDMDALITYLTGEEVSKVKRLGKNLLTILLALIAGSVRVKRLFRR